MKTFNKVMLVAMVMVMIISVGSMVFADYVPVNPVDSLGTSNVDVTEVKNFAADAVSIITTAASAIAIIVLIILGIRYMMGSAEEKAEYKKVLVPYILGAALVFGAATVTGLIFNIVTK